MNTTHFISNLSSTTTFKYNAILNCAEICYGETYCLTDMEDFMSIMNNLYNFTYEIGDEYPSANYNTKRISCLEFLYLYSPKYNIFIFENGDNRDLRRKNVSVLPAQHTIVKYKYPDAIYIGSHYSEMGKYAYQMKNPVWKIRENDEDVFIMFGNDSDFCKLCTTGYNILLNLEKNIFKKPVTWSIFSSGYAVSSINAEYLNFIKDESTEPVEGKKLIAMHQLLMKCFGNGRGTSLISVDHINRDKLDNRLCNLRLATKEMQQANSKGILPGTKRDRQKTARPLPEGITQDIMKKYVVYNVNVYNKDNNSKREYFSVEHPGLEHNWESSKSGKISIFEKLESANKVAEDLEHGIYPIKNERRFPKYISLSNSRNKDCLVFDRKGDDGKRYNVKYTLKSNYDLTEEILRFKEMVKQKYGESVLI
jgi:hypothetical protein